MQAMNPFLPLNEYIPDGEPHVFGDRVYLFGSHDKENGDTFCMLDYVVYSASVDDLSVWSTKGVSYSGKWDPLATEDWHDLYAPDVVQGNDGRFYLYYSLSGHSGKHGYDGPIGVAVCDTPDGVYEFYGHVTYPNGELLKRFVPFDPAVINDDGVIRLYYGTCNMMADMESGWTRFLTQKIQMSLFSKSKEELRSEPDGVMGAVSCILEDDMTTVKEGPVKIIPAKVKGTRFEGHGFFEASSIRKIGDTYYFIYSSQNCHELCYATSKYPDRDFVYRGTIISNGDIGYRGRKKKDALNTIGNNHGSIACIRGQWYVFYHRHTNKSSYSRQALAEPITILPDGTIPQVEMTSCGLNGEPLSGIGTYPAAICCNLTNGHMPIVGNGKLKRRIPYIKGRDGKTIISDISNGTMIGYKYFTFSDEVKLKVNVRGSEGIFEVRSSMDGVKLGEIPITAGKDWHDCEGTIKMPAKKSGLFLTFIGKGTIEFREFIFSDIPPESSR